MTQSSLEQSSLNKVILVGNSLTGKSSIISRADKGYFDKTLTTTLGANSIQLIVDMPHHQNGSEILQVWDTAGQETYKCLLPFFIRNNKVAIIVCSIDLENSIKGVQEWIDFVLEITPSSKIIIAVNKSDLISIEQINLLNEEMRLKYGTVIMVSAKTGSGISELFRQAAIFTSGDDTSQYYITPSHKSRCC